jgi:hypothetical protein
MQSGPAAMKPTSFLVAGKRHRVGFVTAEALASGQADLPGSGVDFEYALAPAAPSGGWVSLGGSPWVMRPLSLQHLSQNLPNVPLFAPFGHKPRRGFRELEKPDPRFSRLWGRFSVDVPVAMERDSELFVERIFSTEGYRTFIMEDGDRYAIRATCIFAARGQTGDVVELLHDRTLEGMRGAMHLLGLALRAMADAGATVARAVSLPGSGSQPILIRHAFTKKRSDAELLVRCQNPELLAVVARRENWYLSSLDLA